MSTPPPYLYIPSTATSILFLIFSIVPAVQATHTLWKTKFLSHQASQVVLVASSVCFVSAFVARTVGCVVSGSVPAFVAERLFNCWTVNLLLITLHLNLHGSTKATSSQTITPPTNTLAYTLPISLPILVLSSLGTGLSSSLSTPDTVRSGFIVLTITLMATLGSLLFTFIFTLVYRASYYRGLKPEWISQGRDCRGVVVLWRSGWVCMGLLVVRTGWMLVWVTAWDERWGFVGGRQDGESNEPPVTWTSEGLFYGLEVVPVFAILAIMALWPPGMALGNSNGAGCLGNAIWGVLKSWASAVRDLGTKSKRESVKIGLERNDSFSRYMRGMRFSQA